MTSIKSDAWGSFRREMPVTAGWAYFDHAAVAPISGPARRAMAEWLRETAEDGDTKWPRWNEEVEHARSTAAELLGTTADRIALTPNTTAGLGLVAEGWPWKAGDNVVFPDNEFPSNQYPWLNLASRGVEPRRVRVAGAALDCDALFRHCDARTRLIAVSWVGYSSGFRLNVGEVVARAHERGIAVMLDAIQGLGVFPLDVRATDVDFVAADGHKWLLGPEGAGILYVRPDHLDRLRPLNVGWHSVAHAHDFSRIDWQARPEAARYEGGTQNMAGMMGLGASIRLLLEQGVGPTDMRLARRVLELSDTICERLAAIGARVVSSRREDDRSGIVSFEFPGRDPQELKRSCLAAGVALSVRNGWLRVSAHGYNNSEDIDRLVAALDAGRAGV